MKSEWKECTLGDLITFQRGHDLPKSVMTGSGYPAVGSNGIIGYHSEYTTDEPSISVGRSGNVGNPFIYYGRTWSHNTALYIKEFKDTDPVFIYYFLKTLDLGTYAGGSAVPTLNRNHIHTLPVRVPIDILVQKQIGEFLKSFDDKIELNNAINKNLEQQAQALFKSWFVDFEPFGGVMPEGWQLVKIDDITSLVSRGITPKYSDDSDQIVINQKCIRNHIIDLSPARTHTPKVVNDKWLRFGDLLINSTGEGTLGRTAQVWFYPTKLTVDSHITIVRPMNELLIYYIGLWGILHEKEIESLHTGSTGQTELPRDRVKAMNILLPDNVTLNSFNAIIAPMTSTIVSNQEENCKLATLRDTLLPQLMSGELDVSKLDL